MVKLVFHERMEPAPLLLLLVGVPPTPSSLRVRVWRRLRSLGAVPLKRSAYLLPDTPERYEDFQWLAQEIRSEEHTSELQSQSNLVCRLLLEKKKKTDK